MTMLNKPRQNDDETRSASWPTDDGHRGNRMSLETATLLAACLSGFRPDVFHICEVIGASHRHHMNGHHLRNLSFRARAPRHQALLR
jgi:hypothetical protein